MDAWANADAAVVVDATSSGAKPGTIIRLDVAATAVRSSLFRYSSHAFGLAEAIELARALGQLPRRLLVFGIEGADFTMGEGLSPEVNAAVPTVVAAITDEMGVRPPAQH
jgi:hydrogenase maturation protease